MSTSSIDCDAADHQRTGSPRSFNASPTTASPMRGVRLFRSISRRLSLAGRRRSPGDSSDLSTSPSSSSSSSSSGSSDSVFSLAPRLTLTSWPSTSSLGGSASSGSEDGAFKGKVKRVLATLGVGTRDAKKATATTPKSILRAPMTTTFVRGMSGLPRRVPSRSCPAGWPGEVVLFSR